jgi:hypothetical protein
MVKYDPSVDAAIQLIQILTHTNSQVDLMNALMMWSTTHPIEIVNEIGRNLIWLFMKHQADSNKRGMGAKE